MSKKRFHLALLVVTAVVAVAPAQSLAAHQMKPGGGCANGCR
jgi:hypothetical protein